MVSKRMRYSGQVQGVGFRYTARRLAEGFAVTGFVRNLSSGQVELHAEGDVAEVEGFLAAVREQMGDLITQVEMEDQPPAGHRDFVILH